MFQMWNSGRARSAWVRPRANRPVVVLQDVEDLLVRREEAVGRQRAGPREVGNLAGRPAR